MPEYKKPTEYVLRSQIDSETGKVVHNIPKDAGVWVGDVLESYRAFAETALNSERNSDVVVEIKGIELKIKAEAELSD